MSFAVQNYFRHLKLANCSRNEVRIISKFFLHCSARQRQNEGGEKKPTVNFVGPPDTPKSIAKQDLISRAMLTYLERKQKVDEFKQINADEFDLGRRHLANIMGIEEDEMTSEKIREALSYLMPSSLSNRKARPLLEPPEYYFPQNVGNQFDVTGRPYHFLYYTYKANYYGLMHDLALKLETLKRLNFGLSHTNQEQGRTKVGVEWISFNKFVELFPEEKVTEHDYRRFLVLVERIDDHPLGQKYQDFLDQYRITLKPKSESFKLIQPLIDEDGREYVKNSGKRKTSEATVKLFNHGHGNININGKDITYFKDIMHRQAILAPLQLCGVVDKFDIEANVMVSAGPSADAGAIRIAVAKSLACFVPDDMKEHLRIAGYLTVDPRRRERKKAGQEGARMKFPWKKR
ncbi:37S ribosomal protein S9 [Mactra antiquata]